MVGTRPTNKLKKVPFGEHIDLTKPPAEKKKKATTSRRKIVMEETPSPSVKDQVLSSPSPGTTALLENLAHTDATPPPEAAASGEENPSPAEQSKQKGRKSSSSSKKKETAVPTTSKRPRSESSNAKSSHNEEEVEGDVEGNPEEEVGEETLKELSLQGSSSSGGEDEEEEDDVVEEARPRKRSKAPVRKVKAMSIKEQPVGRKTVVVRAKDDVSKREVVVPKTIDFELLDRIGIGEKVKEYFKNIGWGKFLEWDTTVYRPLVDDFYSSLMVETEKGRPVKVKFTLFGDEHTLPIVDLDIMLGMISYKGKYSKEYQAAIQEIPTSPRLSGMNFGRNWRSPTHSREACQGKRKSETMRCGCVTGSSPSTSSGRKTAAAPSLRLSSTYSGPC